MIQKQLSLKTLFLIFIYLIISTSNGLLATDSDSILVIFEGSSGEGVSSAEAGLGLSYDEDTINVNVDNSTIEIDSDILRVKEGGITGSHISPGSITAEHISSLPIPSQPTITNISPDNLWEDYTPTTITITGTNFEEYARVMIGDVELTDVIVTDGISISATLPDGLAVGTYDVSVYNWWKETTSSNAFEVKLLFPTDGLVAYYKLDETTGTTAIDSHGSNNGTANNSRVFTSSITGIVNTGADFTQGNDYINLSDISWVDNTDEITVSVWVYFSSVTSRGSIIVKSHGYGPDDMVFVLEIIDGDRFNFQTRDVNDNHEEVRIDPTDWFVPAQWYHIVGVLSSTNISLYVNGSLANSTARTGSGNFNPNSNILAIGKYGSWNGYYFSGYVDEVGFWNRALTPEEVEILYNSGDGISLP